MAKAPTKKAKAKKGFEETLWDTANQLRGSVESSEYKHVVLSLVFLKFISDKFEARRKKMIADGQADFLEMEVFYQQEEDGVAFETKMRELSKTLFEQMKQAEELDRAIRKNLEALGYGL
ncbi:TPA: type I restriction-modification system subunit M N-terminal domain-containing protein [Escherichia coli]